MIENYLLHEEIGQGEYGRVYRATDTFTQSTYAVKIVEMSKLNQNPKLLELSLTEIKVLQQVSHCPYIVQFVQLIKTATQYCFVYEYCSGGPLDKMLSQQGHLQEQQALVILWQLLQAFKILQQNRIMHRDLKPSNILIQNGVYKLADFGFCKPMEERLGGVTTTMLGSPIYMAPEVLRGLPYDNRADVWSLGAVLYELLVGRCPFEEKSIAKLITAQDDSEWCVPHKFQLKPQTHLLLKSMLVKDPQKRCTWNYLFDAPLTKDGEFVSAVLPYTMEFKHEYPSKTQNALQPLDFNVSYNKDQFTTTFQQYSVPFSPRIYYNVIKDAALTPKNQITTPKNYIQIPEQVSKPYVNHTSTNSYSLPQDIQFKFPPHIYQPEEPLKNVLGEVIRERNKIYFQCKTLSDVTRLNLLERSSITGFWILLLLNRRYQCLLKVIKNYLTQQEFAEYPTLNALSLLLQKRNLVKKLVNNFEFVRLVDTVEKEAAIIFASISDYKSQLDVPPNDAIELREQNLVNTITSVVSAEQSRQIALLLVSYVNQLRSQYYLAFIDFKNESDKHILMHAIQILDNLQLDAYFARQGNKLDEVVEEFDDYGEQDKRQLNEKFEDLLRRLTPST